MAKRKAGPLLAVGGVALVGVLAYGTLTSGGDKTTVADTGGGAVPSSPGPPAPYAISTLGAIGTAAQDPGGGGGGTGVPGQVGPPAIQGAQGGPGATGYQDAGDTLYFSGVNLLDPNRSATTSGQNTFGGPGVGSAVGGIGGVLGGGGTGGGGTTVTGCAVPPQETDYYAIPLRNNVTFSGNPKVHLNISGGGSVTALLYQQLDDKSCQLVGQGTSSINGGVSDITLGVGGHTFPKGVLPSLVVRANDGASHTISTSSQNPSYLYLPNLTGV